MLQRARQMGTDVIYLWDFWEGENKTGMPPYWNKGDYVPRSDLGGPAAFRRGVDAVHREGGRVIVYVEGLIVYKNSELGLAHGRDMALQDEHGAYYTDYRNYWSMCPADEAWQRRLAEICVGLVRDMDVDGIFLDSYGAQWNHICANARHSHRPETDVWNQGMTEILSCVRAAVREVKPDAIIMTESTSDLLLPVEDGSCDGSLVWHGPLNGHRLLGSPLKYAFPEANIFSNGYTLAQLNQVFALGGNLAVGPRWEEHADYIRTLVALKRERKDALIYGQMLPSPRTTSPDVVAAAFRGERNAVVTVVNTGVAEIGAEVQLPAELAFLSWRSPLTGARVQVDAKSPVRTLSVTLRPGELQVWLGEG
ncbi:MAG: DUF6259 domain-containing protein [Anaerolineae bacterium]|nr:DUF6259 domain-containing protein [Anaerolineae bacterium]